MKMTIDARDRIFVALDVDTLSEAEHLMDQLVGLVTNVKVGLQLAMREGWAPLIESAHKRGFKVFCDTKLKDIPNTIERASYALAQLGPDYFTVMADNSRAALSAVRAGVDQAELGQEAPKIIAVTVLTSFTAQEGREIYGEEVRARVSQFASNAVSAGLESVICSPDELSLFDEDKVFADTLLITPGVRPSWAAGDDQSRVATPAEAIKRGADMLVIGRPITRPPAEIGSPQEAVKRIISEIEEELA